jgi:hypothetical protein
VQKAPITVNDGSATPVATTFSVESENGITYTFAERSAGVALGFRRLSVSTKLATGAATVNRAKYAVELPVLATVNGISQLAYTLRANVDVILPVASTDAERKNLFAFLTNGLQNAIVRGAVRDLDPVY